MNRCHHFYACAAVLIITPLIGCHGLSGVRYHEGPIVDDPSCEGCGIGDAGMSAQGADGLIGEMDVTPPINAPHPRFHPLPTRPVFEPEGIEPTASPTRAALASATGSSVAKPAAPSVMAKPSRSAVRLASVDVGAENSAAAPPSSRRKPKVTNESSKAAGDEAVAPSPIEIDEPKELTPVSESSSDMWRPRVGN